MRKLVLIYFCLHLSVFTFIGLAQETPASEEKPVVESVDISGIPESRLSSDLRDAMQKLVGQRFDQLAADEVAFKIQNETSERISAIRQLPASVPGHIKLLFEFGNANLAPDRESNVNSRYTIEDVELVGAPESLLSDRLRKDMHDLAGQKLDEDRAGQIERRIRQELRPSKLVSRRIARGADRDHIRLIYEARKAPLFNFRRSASHLAGQSKQGLSFGLEIPIEHHENRFSFGIVDDGDALIERDLGYRVGFENIKAGTEHLGFRLDYFDYRQRWNPATRLALTSSPDIPGIYRERRGVEPSVTFAADRRFQVELGATVTELQMQDPNIHFQNSNAGFATVTYDNTWESGLNKHHFLADYSIRAATHNLASDFSYTRHVAEARYVFSAHRSEFIGSATAGLLSGHAPLFDRFSLGNTSTLRGWNKYDLTPLGGNRMAHGSLEYRYTVLQVYYDVGSAWDHAGMRRTSHAVGFGIHGREKDGDWFLTFGVPIRSGHVQPLKPIFMGGVRF